MDRASDSGSECWGFESLRPYHVGASFVSLAPTYFISQSALTPLLLLSNCDLLCWARSWWAALRAAFFVSDRNISLNRPSQKEKKGLPIVLSFELRPP